MSRDGRDDGIVEERRSSKFVTRLDVPVMLSGGTGSSEELEPDCLLCFSRGTEVKVMVGAGESDRMRYRSCKANVSAISRDKSGLNVPSPSSTLEMSNNLRGNHSLGS